ncbi:hypothetical protein CLV25_11925 [Acetobacteroides hydrogenigenes]|uniref:Uncharacterized protein n=1 Tax=Acetobacteroides hydrogenigenes TaxID=979970 RepID=A0A4R2E6W0_9BACT|nr:hypothetical protein CLV25_11925 [Acetobacteroides hydrogenigenes]
MDTILLPAATFIPHFFATVNIEPFTLIEF